MLPRESVGADRRTSLTGLRAETRFGYALCRQDGGGTRAREVEVTGKRHGWDGEQDRLNPLRFVLLLLAVGAAVAFIWWASSAGYIKHVEKVPPPITAPSDTEADSAAPPQ
jgi:hypothetical protein